MKKLSILVFALILCACASTQKIPPGQDTYFVMAGGSDRNNGFSQATAFRSLFKAMAAASRGSLKKITVLGTLDAASEQSTNLERVFLIQSMGKDPILICGTGEEPAVLSALGSGRRVVLIRGTAPIRFENIEISGGSSSGEGGGLGIGPGSTVILGPGAVVRDNVSQHVGGGVVVGPGASLTVEGGTITGNRSAAIGGGIAVMGVTASRVGVLEVREGEISNNRAQGGGGVAVFQGSACTLSGGGIYDNTADLAGGGVLVSQYAVFTMEGGLVRGNRSLGSGGGLALLEAGGFMLKNGEIHGNRASEHGGGIAADNTSVISVEGGFISANEAAVRGGGVFTAGTFDKSGGKIYGNDVPNDTANIAEAGTAVFVFRGTGMNKIREESAGENLALNAASDEGWGILEEKGSEEESFDDEDFWEEDFGEE